VSASPEVLVMLGTDHHRFDRLVGWIDEWLARQTGAAVSALVQHGSSAVPRIARGLDLVPHHELQSYLATAAVVVCHGGPATMLEVRRTGKKPIVVPRDPARREHVDNHQQLFSRRMSELGLVILCETQVDFEAALDTALELPDTVAVTAEEGTAYGREVARAVAAAGAIIDDLAAWHARKSAERVR
jgi:UDP-N-acetylglucosamine transferase subunit ALG13